MEVKFQYFLYLLKATNSKHRDESARIINVTF